MHESFRIFGFDFYAVNFLHGIKDEMAKGVLLACETIIHAAFRRRF